MSTTLTARVIHVLPNGALVVEAAKDIQINSERQTITVRGVVRPSDIDATNSVRSNRLGQTRGPGQRARAWSAMPSGAHSSSIALLLGLLPF